MPLESITSHLPWHWVTTVYNTNKVGTCSFTFNYTDIHWMWLFFPTDENNIEGDSDVDLQDENTAEDCSVLSQKGKEIPWNKSALSNNNQDTTTERTKFRKSDDMCSMEMISSKKHRSKIKNAVLPMMLQTQSSSSLSAGYLQTLDFSSAPSQQLLKLRAPLLFRPGQLSLKPEAFSTTGIGYLSPSLSGVNNPENRGLSSQSITSPSPFMLQLSQHMLTSQVRFNGSIMF